MPFGKHLQPTWGLHGLLVCRTHSTDCLFPPLQAEQVGNTVSINVPQVQLINPENQIVEVSGFLLQHLCFCLVLTPQMPLRFSTHHLVCPRLMEQ